MTRPDIHLVLDFLNTPTPREWVDAACDHIEELLIDHANCEKKAASTALALMYRYVDQPDLLRSMSKLAREELRHFEQVLDVMDEQGVSYRHLSPSRYAQNLHQLVRKQEPERLVDQLILGAVVEARSCERFQQLTTVLPATVADLYRQLQNSEARHFRSYLELAQHISRNRLGDDQVDERVGCFLVRDAELVTAPDAQFRFHSGVPG